MRTTAGLTQSSASPCAGGRDRAQGFDWVWRSNCARRSAAYVGGYWDPTLRVQRFSDDAGAYVADMVATEQAGSYSDLQQQKYPVKEEPNLLHLLVSPDGRDGSIKWMTDANLYAAKLDPESEVEHAFGDWKHGWVQVVRGSAHVNGEALEQGDAVAISDENEVKILAGTDGTEVLLFELA